MTIVETVYRLTGSFPQCEIYGLASQLRRAPVSIPANIAEGHCREYIKEYLNFLSNAQGSIAERETELEIAGRLRYIEPGALSALMAELSVLAKQMRALRTALAKRSR